MSAGAPLKREQLVDPNPAQRRRLNPEDNLAASGGNLAERLVSQAARNDREMVQILKLLSDDTASETLDPLVRTREEFAPWARVSDVFNRLIVLEEYEVLVDAVSACNSLLAPFRQEDGEFKSNLTLRLPSHWSPPGGLQHMVDAISRIKVVQITVCPPPGSIYASVATSHCVGALLAAGASCLDIECPMQSPEVLSLAIQNSQLKSITLGAGLPDDLTHAQLASFGSLAQGLACCPTFKHLCIAHQHLFPVLHPVVASFSQPGGPTLTSADVRVDPDIRMSHGELLSDTMLLMHALRVHPLSTLNLTIPIESALDLELMLLIPFSRHQHLTKLGITFDNPVRPSRETMGVLPDLVKFWITCPQLTTFAWEFPFAPDTGRAMVELQRAGVDIVQSARSLEMVAMMRSPGFKLKDVSIVGLSIPSDVSKGFMNEVSRNTTLNALRLLVCMDLETIKSLERLRHHPTLGRMALSDDVRDYFLLARNGLAYTFLSNHANDSDSDDDFEARPTEFNLMYPAGATDQEQLSAASTFEPIRSLANTFLPMLGTIMADNRQLHAQQARQTQGLQQRAMAPPVLPVSSDQGDRPTPLENPLQRVKLAALSDADKALYDRVLAVLQAVGSAADLMAAIGPTTPLNGVDDRGANALILKAVQLNRADFVTVLRERGARDFGGHGAKHASSSDVVNAFN